MKTHRRTILSLLVLACLALILLGQQLAAVAFSQAPIDSSEVVVNESAAQNLLTKLWQFDVVALPGYFDHMSDRSLSYDSAGNLHLAYGGDQLYHAVYDGQTWQVTIVDEVSGTGTGAAIALDTDDRAHISYLDLANYDLKYARWTGTEWAVDIVDDAYGYAERTSIALDSNNRPHIVYKQNDWQPPNYTCPGMGYAHWSGSQWQIERFSDCGNFASLALDASGGPHISFYDNSTIRYAHKADGSWQDSVVGSSSFGYGSSIALDSSQQPHVAYIDDEDSGQLVYAHLMGDTWMMDPIRPADDGLNVSLVVDDTDTPHIAYRDEYLTRSGDQWITVGQQQLLAAEESGPNSTVDIRTSSFNALTLDASNRPAISYGNNWAIYCKQFDGNAWNSEQIDQGSEAGMQNALALDSHGAPYIGYYAGVPGLGAGISLSQHLTETWATELITGTYYPQLSSSAYAISLALDSHDVPQVSFWQSTYYSAGLYYGRREGGVWHLEIIADDADSPSQLVVDGQDSPHVVFVDDSTLKYAVRSNDSWSAEDVASGVLNSTVSLALDVADRPAMVYVAQDSEESYLRYAHWTGADWQMDDVEQLAAGQMHLLASLTLDSSDQPHIAYTVDVGSDVELRYATRNGSSWLTETVDDRRWSKGTPSLVLDDDDRAYIAYGYSDLSLASRTDAGWTIDILRNSRCGQVSLATDASTLMISFYDARSHGLMLAEPLALAEKVNLPLIVRP
ncbi:MAG: hypothetical protein R3300_01640 [Candidatus Promineifilaceae bacterium]|nr:hypothetical protein [Candidatus Promineifilaceae bacterium]